MFEYEASHLDRRVRDYQQDIHLLNYTPNTRIRIEHRYTPRPSNQASCYLGEWTDLPFCEEDSCYGTPVLIYGNATASDCGNVSLPGSVCVNVCYDQYSPVGDWTCSRGQWEPQDAMYCEPGCGAFQGYTAHINFAATAANCVIGTQLGYVEFIQYCTFTHSLESPHIYKITGVHAISYVSQDTNLVI